MGILILVLMFLYFLPAIIGFCRHKRNAWALFALNFFLGWTCIGWVVSIVWSLLKDEVVVVTKVQ